MSECAPSLPAQDWRALRVARIQQIARQKDLAELQFRREISALASEDTEFGYRKFVADELAIALQESCGVTERWMMDAQVLLGSPAVMDQVASQVWSMRQADAVLEEVCGLPSDEQRQVIELILRDASVRTPYQLRRAARAAVMLFDLDAAERRAKDAVDNRRVSASDYRDGSGTLMATGSKAAVAQLMAALDAMCLPKQAGDERSLQQRRFDTLMDLVCGRREAGQWEATVLVSLATLEGGNEPAEIPGMGLITPAEARELLADARVRRAVVNEQGVLEGVDVRVESPDLPVVEAEPCTVSNAVEEPFDEADDDITAQDLADYLALQDQTQLYPTTTEASELQEGLIEAIEQFLADQVLVDALGSRGQLYRSGQVVEIDYPPHGGPGSDGRDWPPKPPPPHPHDPDYWSGPEPEPPSWSDRDWYDSDVDREAVYSEIDKQVAPAKVTPVDLAMPRGPRTGVSRWSAPALARLTSNLRTRTPDPMPAGTTAYALPVRLARHIKLRDVTCTFPGCTRLARRCQNDHVVEYPVGATSCANTSSECVHHHQAKHAIFRVVKQSDGVLTWTTTYGLIGFRLPRPLLRGW